eukprot:2162905-Pyramimonas_sp.AAC.1
MQLRIASKAPNSPARPLSLQDVDGRGAPPATGGCDRPRVSQEPRRRHLLKVGQGALRGNVGRRGAQELLFTQRVPGG